MIKKATTTDCELLSQIIRDSFLDVAVRFSLTKNNCPRHPSHCQVSWIESDMDRGVQYFVLFANGSAVGCVGVEHPLQEVCYLERLAVLPENRGNGFGSMLVRHAMGYAAVQGAATMSIGIIAAQTELKQWYERFAFVDVEIKTFSHLPFQVCMMECALQSAYS